MIEAPHRPQRRGICQPSSTRRHFEYPAVGAAKAIAVATTGTHRRFFTGEPSVPWRGATSTISDGSAQGSKLSFYRQGLAIQHDVRGTAWQHAAVASIETLGNLTSIIIIGPQFVVPHQNEFAIFALKAAHTVCFIWHWGAIVHQVSQLGQYAVIKTLRQVEQAVWIFYQGAVTDSTRRLSQAAIRATQHGEGGKGCSCLSDKPTARYHVIFSCAFDGLVFLPRFLSARANEPAFWPWVRQCLICV